MTPLVCKTWPEGSRATVGTGGQWADAAQSGGPWSAGTELQAPDEGKVVFINVTVPYPFVREEGKLAE